MLYWWPKVENLGIPTPKTLITTNILEGFEAAREMGFPVFMRTDLCSGKHDWENSCYVDSEEKLYTNFLKVEEGNVRWEMLGIKPKAVVIREFLDLETTFTAFIGNMPITKERRYFVKDGNVLCHHPYWPKSAFNNHPARMSNDVLWEQKLEELNKDDISELILTEYSRNISDTLNGYWSIDFAKGRNGIWYLIDMALGENSYHWPECKIRP
jgi:hypothetical protein